MYVMYRIFSFTSYYMVGILSEISCAKSVNMKESVILFYQIIIVSVVLAIKIIYLSYLLENNRFFTFLIIVPSVLFL